MAYFMPLCFYSIMYNIVGPMFHIQFFFFFLTCIMKNLPDLCPWNIASNFFFLNFPSDRCVFVIHFGPIQTHPDHADKITNGGSIERLRQYNDTAWGLVMEERSIMWLESWSFGRYDICLSSREGKMAGG